ncbi:hypothetical protein [Mycobacterium sp. 236(2023)]|uniref:hypothetical protein n=1 Tax=Mycobacterium sp. 236(2023) TaxID=3038163 RepID=UPI002414D761|nr:hypothetical protein [Mycobacterium sp. 236(2023)]MDG4663613.1 hypothetical protein [Mycobacterium sp. 236(2023)]
MLSRMIIVSAAAAAAVFGATGVATAQPAPNVNAMTMANPKDYAANDGNWYAFSALDGVTCVMDRASGSYGCSGPLPAAPNGANMVSGNAGGGVGFANSAQPMYGAIENAPALPPNSRLSFKTVSCGNDGFVTLCINTFNQSGFVISPAGSYAF